MARQVGSQPTRKVLGATGGYGVGKALSTILIFGLERLNGGDLPGEIRLAAEVLIEAAFLFAGAYFISPSSDDSVIPNAPVPPVARGVPD